MAARMQRAAGQHGVLQPAGGQGVPAEAMCTGDMGKTCIATSTFSVCQVAPLPWSHCMNTNFQARIKLCKRQSDEATSQSLLDFGSQVSRSVLGLAASQCSHLHVSRLHNVL